MKKNPIPTAESMASSKPKEPKQYVGYSYKGRKCPKHKVVLVKDDDHHCCDCCCGGGCEPEYHCPKCEELYDNASAKWFGKWGHVVAFGEFLRVRDGKLMGMNGVTFRQMLHGGKPIKRGSWCKLDSNGCIIKARKPSVPQMLVI